MTIFGENSMMKLSDERILLRAKVFWDSLHENEICFMHNFKTLNLLNVPCFPI